VAEHTTLTSLFPPDRTRLRAFRRAAGDLYRVLGDKIGARLSVGSNGRVLLPENDLRAAAPALRLVLLEREPAYFPAVVAALRLLKDPAIDTRLEHICSAWERVEAGIITFYDADEPLHGSRIRDAWLYGELTHQGDNWKGKLDRLRNEGELAVFALQVALLGHARLVMALDAVIADVYGESHVWLRSDARDERFFG
jgi:hypothetical protein